MNTKSTTIVIQSGEGCGPGHEDIYRGAPTARALRARLTRERCGGDRWAHLGVRYPAEHYVCGESQVEPIEVEAAVALLLLAVSP